MLVKEVLFKIECYELKRHCRCENKVNLKFRFSKKQ